MNQQINSRALYQICLSKELFSKEEIPYNLFYNVVREFNKLIAEKVITEAYQFKTNIGIFQVVRDERKGKSIDWAASKRRKQEILDSGQIPYSKTESPNGVEWFIYHTGDYFKWQWYKHQQFIKNLSNYIFRTTVNNRRAVAKAIKSDENLSVKYGFTK